MSTKEELESYFKQVRADCSSSIEKLFEEEYLVHGEHQIQKKEEYVATHKQKTLNDIEKALDRIRNGMDLFFQTDCAPLLVKIFSKLQDMEVKDPYDLVEESPSELFAINEHDLVALYQEASKQVEKKNFEAAADMFFVLTWLDGENYRHWMGMGLSHLLANQLQEAQVAYEAMLALVDEETPLPFLYAADYYCITGEKARALELVEEALALTPKEDVQNREIAASLKAKCG